MKKSLAPKLVFWSKSIGWNKQILDEKLLSTISVDLVSLLTGFKSFWSYDDLPKNGSE